MRPLFKCHGGKYYLKKWILDLFPENYKTLNYCEPFIGGGSIFLNKEKSPREVINDRSPHVANLWDTVKYNCEDLLKELESVSYSQESFDRATLSSAGTAAETYIIHRMSRGGLGKSFAWSNRNRGGQPGDVNAWKTSLKQLPKISERLDNVEIYCKSAVEVLEDLSGKNFLVYADPPYLKETRVSKECYDYEMEDSEHEELFQCLNNFDGKVLLSGYDSIKYNDWYKNWNKYEYQIVNHSSQKKVKTKKTECVWTNF